MTTHVLHAPYSGSTKQFLDGFNVGDIRIAQNKKQALAVYTAAADAYGFKISRNRLPDGRYELRRVK